MSIIIGLTGPTGAGKSSLRKTAIDLGFTVVDCDLMARKATERGSEGLMALVSAFSKEILNEDDTLNRKKLASIAFKDKDSTKLLNDTIFPFITKLVKAEIKGDTILDAPTLFESGINKICNKTIAVLADDEIRLKRIMARDKLTLNEAMLRMNAGKNDEFYKSQTDFVLHNNGDEEDFNSRFAEILKELKGGY